MASDVEQETISEVPGVHDPDATQDDGENTPTSARLLDFASTRRFSVVRRIGAGGMGVVYEAEDRDRGERVALKTLLGVDPAGLYRFKREFRALADVTHPNLVALHELFSEGEQIFFTMEHVRGKSFLESIWDGAPTGDGRKIKVRRLRAALRQLAEGLNALHAAGKLHRDIKPSNVMVEPDGRVVILDFGLVGDTMPDFQSTADGHVMGTPAYMAPEQAAGETLTPAADWYAVGVMLHQALTGALPFPGRGIAVLLAKQESDGPRPSARQAKVPEDLDDLCAGLLRRNPAERLTGREVLERLGAADPTAFAEPTPVPGNPGPFVGREEQLATLHAALTKVTDSDVPQPVMVHVRGRSGMGKSALVRQFLDEVRGRPEVVVLSGRCYERESVPYKALDDLVDSLCLHLMRLPAAEAGPLMPRHIAPLARLFPVLQRVDCIANAPQHLPDDPQELRQRAFEALKELLARIADRGPLVLHVDDLQWGDLDSAELLSEVLRAPEAPALLLVATFRTEEEHASEILPVLPTAGDRRAGMPQVDIVSVDPLTPAEAHRLALALIARHHGSAASDARAAAIAAESAGSPFFVGELVRHSQFTAPSPGSDPADTLVRLDDVVRSRVRELDGDAQRLLELVAVAGRPVAQGIVLDAAGLTSGGHATITRLRSEHLVRTRGTTVTDPVESYHDRIREAVVDSLDAETARGHHRALAAALEQNGVADPEVLAVHYREGGQWLEAGQFAARAARSATEALAFDRAARMFKLALELLPEDDPRRLDLQVGMGDALLNAGRRLEGARALLNAAPLAAPETALELRRRAAEQLLRSGQIDEGLDLTAEVLATIGMRLPRTSFRTFVSFLGSSTRLRFKDLQFDRRPEAEIPPALLKRVDVCAALANGMAGADVLLAWDFQTRQTLMALEAGEPSRVARALAMQTVFASLAGAGGGRRARRIHDTATRLADEVDDPDAQGLATFATGMRHLWAGEFAVCRQEFDRAATVFRERCRGVPWHQGLSELFSILTLSYLGELGEMARRHPRLLREFRARDDRYIWVGLQLGRSNLVWLRNDDPEGGRAAAEEALGHWSSRGYQGQHWWGLLAQVQADLYEGKGASAVQRIDTDWPKIRAAQLTRIRLLRVELTLMRAHASLCAAESEADPGAHLARAEQDAAAVARDGMEWTAPLVKMIQAAVVHLRGDSERAVAMLEAVDDALSRHRLKAWGAAANYVRGHLRGPAGRADLAAARELLAAEGVVDPGRMVRLLAPGFRAHLA